MSPRDPFEAFRQSADQERAFPFQEEDWKDLEQRLESTQAVKPTVYPSPWWLLPLLLPVLGLLLSLHYRGQEQYAINHQLLSEIEQLRTELSTQQQPTTITQYDTVVIERKVYRDRPARNTAVIQNNNLLISSKTFPALYDPYPTSPKFLPQPANPIAAITSTSALVAAKEVTASPSLKELATALSSTDKGAKQLAIYSLPTLPIIELPLKANMLESLPYVQPPLLHPQKMRIFKQPLIRSLDLTLVGGGSIASKPPQANLLSVHLGARLNARLGHGWMLFTGLATRISVYELNSPDPSLGLPVVDTPVEGYTLEDIQVQENSNWWLLGAGWELPSRNRWRPFFEISYRKPFSHVSELTYAFQDLNGPEVLSEIDATLTPRPSDRLMGGAGIWYVPKRSTIQFGLGSTWSFPLGADLLNQPRAGLNARLGIDF